MIGWQLVNRGGQSVLQPALYSRSQLLQGRRRLHDLDRREERLQSFLPGSHFDLGKRLHCETVPNQ